MNKLDRAVNVVADILQKQLEKMPPAKAKKALRDLKKLAANAMKAAQPKS